MAITRNRAATASDEAPNVTRNLENPMDKEFLFRVIQPSASNTFKPGQIKAEDWLHLFERNMSALNCSEDALLVLVANYMDPSIQDWCARHSSLSWEDWKTAFLTKFTVKISHDEAISAALGLRMGDSKLPEFKTTFQSCMAAANIEDWPTQRQYLMNAVPYYYKDALKRSSPTDQERAWEILRIEVEISNDKAQRRATSERNKPFSQKQRSFQPYQQVQRSNFRQDKRLMACNTCGQLGHFSYECPTTQKTVQSIAAAPTIPSNSELVLAANPRKDPSPSEKGVGVVTVDYLAQPNGSSLTHENRIVIDGQVGTHSLRAIVDTGAAVSVIGSELLKSLNLISYKATTSIRIKVADDRTMEINTKTNIPFMISSLSNRSELYPVTAWVIPGSWTYLLGMDWLDNYSVSILIQTRKLILKQGIQTTTQVCSLTTIPTDISEIINKYDSIFATDLSELSSLKGMEHVIDTGTARPVAVAPYRVKPQYRNDILKQVTNMLENNIIEECSSPWLAPIVPVEKKDGKLRLCIDYRKLNAITKRDEFCLPLADDLFEELGSARIFSKLDAFSGFWQIPLAVQDRDKTAFGLRGGGQFRFKVMPFGLTNAPATFQRTMEGILKPLLNKCCTVFIDDILIYSKTHQEHLEHVVATLTLLQAANVTLNRDKCFWGISEVEYLGFIVGNGKLRPVKDKVDTMTNTAEPHNRKALQSFLGLISYYRRFIKDFALLARPLFSLLRKDSEWKWTTGHSEACSCLKRKLSEASELTLPDFTKPFKVTTDGSAAGLGAILSQVHEDGRDAPIWFASRTTSVAESKYCATDLELLAVKWAFAKFRHFLIGRAFHLETDHQALLQLLKATDITGMRARWSNAIREFDFTVTHRKGATNPADFLSRAVFAIAREATLPEIVTMPQRQFDSQPRTKRQRRWRAQLKYTDGHIETTGKHRAGPGRTVVWGEERVAVLTDIHKEGHQGIENTLKRARLRYWGEGLRKIAEQVCKECDACARHNPPRGREAELHPLQATKPLEIVGMDIVGPLPGPDGTSVSILTAIDYFTRWPFARIYSNITAETVKQFICEEILATKGIPKKIITDRGPQFISADFEEFCHRLGISHHPTTAYHPQCNGSVERLNQTLERILTKFRRENKDWTSRLWQALMVIRATPNNTTSFSPAQLWHGAHLTTPSINRVGGGIEGCEDTGTLEEYYRNLNRMIEELRLDATKRQRLSKNRMKSIYDRKVRKVPNPQVGSKVLLAVPTAEKMAPEFEGPYTVLSQNSTGAIVIRDALGRQDVVARDRIRNYADRENLDLIEHSGCHQSTLQHYKVGINSI